MPNNVHIELGHDYTGSTFSMRGSHKQLQLIKEILKDSLPSRYSTGQLVEIEDMLDEVDSADRAIIMLDSNRR